MNYIKLVVFSFILGGSISPSSLADDFTETVEVINRTMQEQHYNPAELSEEHYQSILHELREMAGDVSSQTEFISRFRRIWGKGPFSHTVLAPAESSAENLAVYFDNFKVGPDGAKLDWQGEVAILTINTMMGQDTIEFISEAYQQISAKGAKALIIDLRANEGGAFAIKPMVSHLITEPFDAGVFAAQKWFNQHNRPPVEADLKNIETWDGWSLRSFWSDAQSKAGIKVTFQPMEPVYRGPVYILTSSKTASASELATDALRSIARVTIIGETTAGEMLSQKPFDIPGGMQLFVPIADYYSAKSGRIEGNPIVPHIQTNAGSALNKAMSLINY